MDKKKRDNMDDLAQRIMKGEDVDPREVAQGIQDILPEIEKQIGSLQKAYAIEDEAQKLVKSALDQFASLKPDDNSMETHTANVHKIIGDDADILYYGKAIAWLHHKLAKDFAEIEKKYRFKLLRDRKFRAKINDLRDKMDISVSYLLMKKIKAELMAKYELKDPK